jgi:O-antigen ligase
MMISGSAFQQRQLAQPPSWKICAFIVSFAVALDILFVQSPLLWVGVAGMLVIAVQFWKPTLSLAVVILTCGLLSYSPFESGALSRLYPGDLALGIFLVAWLVGLSSWSLNDAFQPDMINRPLLGMAVVTPLSMLWSRMHPDRSVTYSFPHSDVSWGTTQVSQLGLLAVTICMPFAVAATIKSWKKLEAVVIILGIAVALGALVTAAALILGFGGTYSILGATRAYWEQPWDSSIEPLSSLLIPFLYAGIVFGRRSLSRYWLVCVLFALCLLAVALSFSRETWLLAFLGMLVVSGLWLWRRVSSMFSLVLWSQVIVAVVLVGVFASGALGLVSRFYNPDEVYGFERIYFYITALQLFASHPIMGVGAGNYQFFDRTYAEVSAGGIAHNQFLTIAAEMGLPGLLMFLWLLAGLIRFLWKFDVPRTDPSEAPYWIRAAGWAFMACWIVECFFREAFWVTAAAGGGTKAITATIFPWILLGILFGAFNLRKSALKEGPRI